MYNSFPQTVNVEPIEIEMSAGGRTLVTGYLSPSVNKESYTITASAFDKNSIICDDLKVNGSITLPNNTSISKTIIDEDDIIMLTFDPDMYSIDECKQMFEMWQNNFPNHKVIATFKGIKIDLIKDKGMRKGEVVW